MIVSRENRVYDLYFVVVHLSGFIPRMWVPLWFYLIIEVLLLAVVPVCLSYFDP